MPTVNLGVDMQHLLAHPGHVRADTLLENGGEKKRIYTCVSNVHHLVERDLELRIQNLVSGLLLPVGDFTSSSSLRWDLDLSNDPNSQVDLISRSRVLTGRHVVYKRSRKVRVTEVSLLPTCSGHPS